MTTEFIKFTNLYNNLFGVIFDDSKSNAWFNVLGKLKVTGLMKAIQALSLEVKFPPKIKEIVDKYDELKRKQEREQRENQIAEQQKYLLTQSNGQCDCYICQNTGDVFYEKDGYQYYCRCLCAHGKDLNRWSKYQITKGLDWLNPKTEKYESLYVSLINDIFTGEEIEIIKIKKSKIPEELEFKNNYLANKTFEIANKMSFGMNP